MISLDAIWQPPTQQRIYREILLAFGYPGRLIDLTPHLDGSPAHLGVLATLVDNTTSLADPDSILKVRDWDMLESTPSPVEEADFVLIDGGVPPSENMSPRLGDIYQPHRGATLVGLCNSMGQGEMELALRGPGIADCSRLRIEGLHGSWLTRRQEWVLGFPMGVDMLLCDSSRMVGIPRTTELTIR